MNNRVNLDGTTREGQEATSLARGVILNTFEKKKETVFQVHLYAVIDFVTLKRKKG